MVCASANPCQTQKFGSHLRQHYTVQNLHKSSVFSLTHPAGRRSDNKRKKKSPQFVEIGGFSGMIGLNCREVGKFGLIYWCG